MSDPKLDSALIERSTTAFLKLSTEIHHLLDLIDFYFVRYPATSDSVAFKQKQLNLAIRTLGSTPYQLAEVIRGWKAGAPRVLSRDGVQLELLNELQITIEVTVLFFIREGLDLEPFNRLRAMSALADLAVVNSHIK